MKQRRFITLGAILMALSLTVAGCTKATPAATNTQNATQGNKDNENQINPVAYDKVKEGGKLRLDLSSTVPQWNPSQIDGNLVDVSKVLSPLIPTLFDFDAGGKDTVNKDYAVSVELTSTSPQTINIKLNPKAKWSNGRAIDWTDFEAEFKALSGKNEAFKVVSTTGWEQVESVTKGANDQEVIIKFAADKPFSDWKSLFTSILPKELLATPETFEKSWVEKPALTAGPFKWKSVDATTGTVILERDPAWWGKKAKLDEIVFTPIEGADAKGAAMKAGQLDSLNASQPQLYANVKTLPGTQVLKAGGPVWTHVTLGQSGEMKSLKVRQAVQLSLNRTNLVNASVGELPQPKDELQSHIWLNNQADYKATCGDFCKQDLPAAEKLLTSEGWAKNATTGYFEKGGKPLSIQYVANNPSKFQETITPILIADLKAAGIKLDVQKVPSKDFFTEYVIKSQFGMVSFLWQGTPFPISSSSSIYETDTEQNFNKISDPEIDKLYEQAKRELDRAKQVELSYKIDELIWKNAYSLPMVQQFDIIVQNAKLANYGAFGFASVDWTAVGFTA